MKYHSPFEIFESLGIKSSELKIDELKNLEKRLLLELEFSDGVSIVVGSHELTKNDILNLFEELNEQGNLAYHQIILENKQLLSFLQTGEFDEKQPLFNEEILYQPNLNDFKEFISIYLVDIVKKEINFYFNQRNFRKAFAVIEFTKLLSPYYKSIAFDKLAGSVGQLAVTISQFSKEELPLDKKNYKFLSHDHFISFLNALPDEFHDLRERIAINLNNLGAQYQKKELKFVYMIFMALRSLKCSENMRKTIIDNSNILSNSYSHKEEDEEEKSTGYGCFSFIGIIILFFVLVKACSTGLDSELSSNDYIFKNPVKTTPKQFPTLAKKAYHLKFVKAIQDYSSLPGRSAQKSGKTSETPVKPYFAYYTPFSARMSETDSVLISNTSDFDLIVFGIGEFENYGVGIKAQSEAYIGLEFGEEVNLYIGNQWSRSRVIKGIKRRPKLLPALNNGMFNKPNKLTVSQLDIFYRYNASEKLTSSNKQLVVEPIEAAEEELMEVDEEEDDEILELSSTESAKTATVYERTNLPTIYISNSPDKSHAIVFCSDSFESR